MISSTLTKLKNHHHHQAEMTGTIDYSETMDLYEVALTLYAIFS